MGHQQKTILGTAIAMAVGLTATLILAGCGGGGGSDGGASSGGTTTPTASVVIIPAKVAVVTAK